MCYSIRSRPESKQQRDCSRRESARAGTLHEDSPLESLHETRFVLLRQGQIIGVDLCCAMMFWGNFGRVFCHRGIRRADRAAWRRSIQGVAGVELAHAGEATCRTQATERKCPVNSLAVQRVAGSASAARAEFVDRVQIQILGLAMAGGCRAIVWERNPGQNLFYRMQEFAGVFPGRLQAPSASS